MGALQTNCYMLGCEKTKEAVIIDPGDNIDKILKALKDNGLTLKYIINTHAHFDHVGGNAALKKETGAKIVLHERDDILLERLIKQADVFGYEIDPSPPADIFVQDGDTINFGELALEVIHTPGHSPGGISLKIGDTIFSGDTLFRRSIGRTDLPGGSFDHIIDSIREKLFIYDNSTRIYPGHGDSTTIGEEKEGNPYF